MCRTVKRAALAIGIGILAACGGSGTHEHPSIGIAPAEDNAGATATVEGNEHQFVESVQEMLRGKVSGLQVVDLPGCGVTLRIRNTTGPLTGSNCQSEPLLIIDDKPVPPGNMAAALRGLLPLQIDRIQVLKDVASTSVYGTRGANGVVLITTKR